MGKHKNLRFGVIGAGHTARLHAQALRSIPGADITAWAAAHVENATRAADEFGGRPMTASELLERDDVDVVIVATPTDRHARLTIRALQRQKHVFCEKPMTRTLAEAEAVCEAESQSSARLFVGHTTRFFENYRRARELLLAGEIGRLRRIVCRRLNYLLAPPTAWFWEFERSGGCILDLLIHDFDYLCWLQGQPSRVEAGTDPTKDPSGFKHAFVYLRFANDVRAEIEGSWIDTTKQRMVLFEGEAGQIRLDSVAEPLTLENRRGRTEFAIAATDPYQSQMQHFIDRLVSEKPFRVTSEDARNALAVALTALHKLTRKK